MRRCLVIMQQIQQSVRTHGPLMALRNSLAVAQARRAELVEKRRRLYGGDVGASPQKTVRSGPQPSEPDPEPEPELEPLSDRR